MPGDERFASRQALRARPARFCADQGNEEKWGAELERLAAMVESPELIDRARVAGTLRSNRGSRRWRRLPSASNLSFPLRSFAVVIARHGRIRDIGAIAESYRDLLDQQLGRERATLTFAIQPVRRRSRARGRRPRSDRGKKIIPTVKVDPALLGGVTAELGGKIYDGSLATRLAEAKQRLAG